MSASQIAANRALEVIRSFADGFAHGDAASVVHLLHPGVHERTIVAGGLDARRCGPDAVVAEARDVLAPYERPEVLYQTVESVGPLFHWSIRWRLRNGSETALLERHAFLMVENGLITNIDAVCSGKLPEPR